MGEIDEACQVILLCGKLAVQLKNITVATAVMSAQVLNTIYMAKWKGNTSYRRLLNVKGEQNGLVFLNVGIEEDTRQNTRIMKGIKKELKDHGILFAELPDLCGGDGNTQFCISARDASKLSAMLMSHMNGKYKDIPVAEISQFDYTATAQRADGSPTPEFEALVRSTGDGREGIDPTEVVQPEKVPVRNRITSGARTVKIEKKSLTGIDMKNVKIHMKALAEGEGEAPGRGADALSPDLIPDFLRGTDSGKSVRGHSDDADLSPDPGRRRRRKNVFRKIGESVSSTVVNISDYFQERAEKQAALQPGYADGIADPCPNLPKKIVAQIIREHEYHAFGGRDSYMWLDETPVISKEIKGEKYHLVSLPEGDKGIIIPDSAYREYDYDRPSGYFLGNKGAFVCEAREYYTVDYKTGDIGILPGDEAVKAAKKTPVESYAERVRKLTQEAKQKVLLGDQVKSAVSRRL